MRVVSWDSFSADMSSLLSQITQHTPSYDLIICVMRGGCVPACMISNALNVPMLAFGAKSYTQDHKALEIEVYQSFISDLWNMKSNRDVSNVLVVDDLSDTGNTFEYFVQTYQSIFKTIHTAAPYIKTGTSHLPTYYARELAAGEWIEFPWEASVAENKYLHAV